MRILALFLSAAALSGCMNTKIALGEKWNPYAKPAYVDYFDSWWWGLKGRPAVSLQKVCMDQKPLAVQRVKTGEDAIITAFTLGVYAPTTVKVWCGE
jgi:hypothetical protein